MKKTCMKFYVSALIFCCFILLHSTCFAENCSIVWSGMCVSYSGGDCWWTPDPADYSACDGFVPTYETSRTWQVMLEFFASKCESSIFGCTCTNLENCASFCDNEACEYYCNPPAPYATGCSVTLSGTWSRFYGECIDGWLNYNDSYGTWDVECEPTLIQLLSLESIPKAGKVLIQWTTASEIDNAGFNVYRAESEKGEYVKINDVLNTAKGSPAEGASYSFVDNNVQNRKTYWYKLEDIDTNGKSTMHGPVSATPRLRSRDE